MNLRVNKERFARVATELLFVVILISCGRSSLEPATIKQDHASLATLEERQIQKLNSVKVFFGHKSVGGNILEGIKSLMALDPRLKLNLVHSSDPALVPGPAFIEAEIGENGDPLSKNAAFVSALRAGMGAEGGIAFHKYCYVDFTGTSDVGELFEKYQHGIDALAAQHPTIRIIHVTVPLTTVEPAAKAWVKNILGRNTARAANVKRNEFNQLLKQTYPPETIFDLARVESTRPDGSRSYFLLGDKQIYTLAEEYTTDGGHLNALGSAEAARGMLATLADAASKN